MVYDFGCTLLENKCLRYLQDYQSNTKILSKILSSKHSDFYYYLTTNGVLDLPLFAVFCRLRSCQACFLIVWKTPQIRANHGILRLFMKGKIMIKILFGCIRQWYEWKRRIGFWFCKSGQIVTLGKVHYYSFTTIQQMKKIYEHILFYCD